MSVFSEGLAGIENDVMLYHTQRFRAAQEALWKGMKTLFPDCGDTARAYRQVQMIGAQTPLLQQFLKTWHTALSGKPKEPLTYAKAFRRLCSRDPTYYDCAAYRDHRVLFANALLRDTFQCDLVQMFEDSRCQSSRHDCFKLIDILNESALLATGERPTSRPSRKELATNISANSKKKSSTKEGECGDPLLTAGMLRDIVLGVANNSKATASEREAIQSLAETVLPPNAKDTSFPIKNVQSQWAALSEQDRKSATKLVNSAPELNTPEFKAVIDRMNESDAESFAGAVQQFLSLDKIAGSISTGLLRAVQDELGGLNGLVSDNGEVDMSKLDMQRIVPNLMQKIDPQDVKDMAGNIGSLLPEIQKMAGQQGLDVNAVMQNAMAGAGGGGAPDVAALAGMMSGLGVGKK